MTEPHTKEKSLQLCSHKLEKLKTIDKILESRYEAAFNKNGYTKRTKRVEHAWNLITSRMLKLYFKLQENEID